MSPTPLALVIAAAFAHAGWNLAAKRASGSGVPLLWLSMVGSAILYTPVAGLLLLTTDTGLGRAGPVGLAAIGVSGLLHLGYLLLLQRGYAVGDLSVVYPLARGTGPLLSVLVAVVFLAERPGWLGLAGALSVVAGILVISGPGSGRVRPAGTDPTTAGNAGVRSGTGVGYGVLTGLLIATYTVWDAQAVTSLALSPLLYDWGNNLVRTALLSPYAVRRWPTVREVWRRHRPEVVTIAVLGPLAYILVLVAYTMAPVSLVAPARELSIVVGSLAGWLLLREPDPVRRLVGAAVVLGGVVAIAAT